MPPIRPAATTDRILLISKLVKAKDECTKAITTINIAKIRPIDKPIIKPFSLNSFAIIKLSKNDENVIRIVESGIKI